jgi:hypothetical protein
LICKIILLLSFTPRREFFFHPPLNHSEFLKRNEEALLIRVVGGGHASLASLSASFLVAQ